MIKLKTTDGTILVNPSEIKTVHLDKDMKQIVIYLKDGTFINIIEYSPANIKILEGLVK